MATFLFENAPGGVSRSFRRGVVHVTLRRGLSRWGFVEHFRVSRCRPRVDRKLPYIVKVEMLKQRHKLSTE